MFSGLYVGNGLFQMSLICFTPKRIFRRHGIKRVYMVGSMGILSRFTSTVAKREL
jgi:hypothetical protein